MDNPARAVADAPPKAAKGVSGLLKNKPPVFYIVLVAGILAAAWYIRKREANTTPADQTASTVTADDSGTTAGYGTDVGGGAYTYGAGSGAGVDQTGQYLGNNGPVPSGNGYLYDPSTGLVYGALPDYGADYQGGPFIGPSSPTVTGGGAPDTGGVAVHAPPVVTGQQSQPSSASWTCPPAYPRHGTNPGSCYKVVTLSKGDGHGHGKGVWHVYRDGSWHQVS